MKSAKALDLDQVLTELPVRLRGLLDLFASTPDDTFTSFGIHELRLESGRFQVDLNLVVRVNRVKPPAGKPKAKAAANGLQRRGGAK